LRTEEEVQHQLAIAHDEAFRIENTKPFDSGAFREKGGYIEALEWVLGIG